MAQLAMKQSQSPPLLRIEPFKGINLSVTPTQIDKAQSPDMLNMHTDSRGSLNKRTGYKRLFETNVGPGKINGMFDFKKADGTKEILFAHGDKLYRLNLTTLVYEVIYTGVANTLVDTFILLGKMFFLNGTNYLQYDGTTVSEITPYIPTLTISGVPGPLAKGTLLEDFNLLGSGFKETYSGDGTGTVFQLSLKGLDVTLVTIKVDNVDKVEGTHFTVDRTLGKVTFTTAPSNGTNNVEIVAHKAQTGFAERIKKCSFHVLFGGTNDTRVFVSGNPDFPNQMWRSGLYDPTYFPENGFYKVGSDKEKITGFVKQYDFLVIEKESSKGNMQYELIGGEASFPIKPLNDHVGTIAPKTIQVIENNPISLGKTGVHILTQSNVRDERNIVHVSANVDADLLSESNLEKAISIDYDRKYWLSVNNKVYVYDYGIGEWYIYDNIPASCFLELDGTLYFGGEGRLYKFKKTSDANPYSDDGVAINAYWKSKYFVFGADELRKLVEKVFITLKPDNRTSADVYYISNKKASDLVKSIRMDTYDVSDLDFNYYSFLTSDFPQEAMLKIKAKKVTHFQLIIENKRLDESLGLLSTGIKYRYQSEVK